MCVCVSVNSSDSSRQITKHSYCSEQSNQYMDNNERDIEERKGSLAFVLRGSNQIMSLACFDNGRVLKKAKRVRMRLLFKVSQLVLSGECFVTTLQTNLSFCINCVTMRCVTIFFIIITV